MVLRAFPLVAATLFCAGLAAAEESPPLPAAPKVPSPCAADPGARAHDGFFARSEPGLAFLWANVSGSGARQRTGIRGVGQSAALSVGGTPARGLVLGGTVWTARIDPFFIERGKVVVPDDDSVKVTELRIGPFVDWYPQPKVGFHSLVAVELVVEIESDVKGNPVRPEAFGAALALGTGYEWFVASELSLGLIGQLAFGATARAASEGTERTLFIVPELALAATYH